MTPGITKRSTTLGVARGSFEWNGALYGVSGTSLIKITNVLTGAFSTIGTIAGSENIEVDVGFNDAVIVVKNGAIYTLSKSDVLTDISGNSNFVSCVDVAHINGRFVYIPANGDPAFFSDIGAAGTVQAASFFDAEELPDKNSGVLNLRNTLYILGTDSIELFRDTGAFPNPFSRIQGARLDYGYIGGLLEYGNTAIFVGREKGQDFGIYAIGSGTATKISNEGIDLFLQDHSIAELSDAVVNRIKWNGYDLATFRIRGNSFGLFRDQWFLLDNELNGVFTLWPGGFVTQFDSKYYSFNDDNFGVIEGVSTQYGERISRVIQFGFNQPNNQRFGCQSIELGISQGANASIGSVALFMSRDNVEFPIPVYRNLGALGQYEKKLVWNPPGGLGNYEGYMAIKIYTTEDVIFSSDHLIVNF